MYLCTSNILPQKYKKCKLFCLHFYKFLSFFTFLTLFQLCPILQLANSGLIENNGTLLYELGFEIEPFGEDSFVIRAVPADMDSPDAAAALEEICEKLRRGKLDAKSARDEILHTVACKAAIKAGWDTQPLELNKLVEEVLSGRVKYCPHGRPVAVTITRKELDKMFKRIV